MAKAEKPPQKRYGVGVSGSYGWFESGSEAILHSIIARLQASVPVEITVSSRDPEDTMRRRTVDRAIPVRKLSRDEVLPKIERLDVFVLGGGGILFDGEVKQYLREAQPAHEKGVPGMAYAIGAGPLRDPNNQQLVSESLDGAMLLTVRERRAKKVLEDAGVSKDVVITADPALLLSP
jgi:polysaccharide pyruvyl transferase WcaK-like protein